MTVLVPAYMRVATVTAPRLSVVRDPLTIAATTLLLSVSTAMAAERRVEPCLSALSAVHANQSTQAADAGDSVAVTVFSNITGAAEDDWIGTGIAETPMVALEGIGVSRSAENRGAVQDSNAEEAEADAGRILGKRWVISGGYQRLGDRMRSTARIVEVATATVVALHSETDGPFRHV